MSKRLQHYIKEIVFSVKNTKNGDLDLLILQNIDKAIIIYPKYIKKGHTIDNDIKYILKDKVILTKNNNVIIFKISLHIQHYTKLYFDETLFYAQLIKSLNLQCGDVLKFEYKGGNMGAFSF